MSFAEIIGQEDAKNLLKNAVKTGNHSHAYIFSGEKGSGKKMLAEAFAMMLECENPGDDACGKCHSCAQAASKNHPDINYVTREPGKRNITVDIVRSQVVNDVDIKPYSGKYKIYIIDEAERMNDQAQNAILKTIEEPPSYVVIILLTTNHNAFLQTILSRCVLIQMKTIDKENIKKLLQTKYNSVDYQAEMVATFAQGNIGKAIALATDESFNDVKNRVIQLCKRSGRMDEYQIDKEVKEIKAEHDADKPAPKKKKDDEDEGEVNEKYQPFIEQFLDLITLWYRDVLLYKATLNEELLVFKENIYDIQEQAQGSSYAGLNDVIDAISETRARLNSNVNFELTITFLIEKMRQA